MNPRPTDEAAPTLGAAVRMGLFLAWFAAATGVVGIAFGKDHGLFPSTPDLVGLTRLGPSTAPQAWTAWHIVEAGRGCSSRVAEHLASRPRTSAFAEVVLVVGADARVSRALQDAGYATQSVQRAELARLGIPGVPWLVVRGPDGVEYTGAYTIRTPAERRLLASLVGAGP